MSRDGGSPGENIHSDGSWLDLAVLPLVFAAVGGIVLLVLKGATFVGRFLPRLPLVVDLIAVVVVVMTTIYAAVRLARLV